ncbi:MAG: hypothetical protein DWQ42_03635 [Planctomycetota bacterium]|nr:MAG: hypothetical protein DWQ42_03635 [Planctomycetota bacterium]REK46793.1 MAG: hypothetical protein DWQ46_05760 [Planctomycetota bacterium]
MGRELSARCGTLPPRFGYCTNVHAGADLASMQANLAEHALAVRRQVGGDPAAPGDEKMGVGLWLAAPAARALRQGEAAAELGHWLADHGLLPFTLNGFPYGDFHQPVVKHRVYEPNWLETARLEYTLDLVHVLDRILPPGEAGSISTLPLAWGKPAPGTDQLQQAAAHLRQVAAELARLEAETGRHITLALEPEPGCVLQRSEDVVRLFEDHLLSDDDADTVRRYLSVCHDVCHAVVMCEDQVEVLQRYRAAGIRVGKVQVSSAVCVDFQQLEPAQRPDAVAQLRAFAEDRYLHQTTVTPTDGQTKFYEDLPLALAGIDDATRLTSSWRIHFHVPVYLSEFGRLGTSRSAILECLAECRRHADVAHFEVETYAWGVLPAELKQATLADGIAKELTWFAGQQI